MLTEHSKNPNYTEQVISKERNGGMFCFSYFLNENIEFF